MLQRLPSCVKHGPCPLRAGNEGGEIKQSRILSQKEILRLTENYYSYPKEAINDQKSTKAV